MPFLLPIQQYQSTEAYGHLTSLKISLEIIIDELNLKVESDHM